MLLSRIIQKYPNVKLTILDYKGFDYRELGPKLRLFTHDDVFEGLRAFYTEFQNRLSGMDTSSYPRVLLIEELFSMLSFYSKKDCESIRKMINELLVLGRSYNIINIVSTQRFDASLLGPGVRDSVSNVFAFGNLSSAAKDMVAGDLKEEMNAYRERGQGYLVVDKSEILKVIVPKMLNEIALNELIAKALE